jgi:hypothetical protein
MPINNFPVTGKIYASNGTSPYSGVSVTLRNLTKKSSETKITESDGSFAFDLANFVGGYANGDSLKLEALIGSFYQSTTLTVDTSLPGIDQSLTLAAETVNRIMDPYKLKEELIIFFRKKLTDPLSRGAIKTSTQSGTGSKIKFDLPDDDVKFIDCIYVNGTLQTNYTGYYVDYNDASQLSNPVVYFLTPPTNGAIVEIRYSYGQSWIYPDTPRNDLSISSYPRVNVNFISIRTMEDGLGSLGNITDILGSIVVWSIKENELASIITEARALIMQNKKDFHYFKLIIPQSTSPVLIPPNREEKILQQSQDFIIPLCLEVI